MYIVHVSTVVLELFAFTPRWILARSDVRNLMKISVFGFLKTEPTLNGDAVAAVLLSVWTSERSATLPTPRLTTACRWDRDWCTCSVWRCPHVQPAPPPRLRLTVCARPARRPTRRLRRLQRRRRLRIASLSSEAPRGRCWTPTSIHFITIPEMHRNNMSSGSSFCWVVATSFSLLATDRVNLCTKRYRKCHKPEPVGMLLWFISGMVMWRMGHWTWEQVLSTGHIPPKNPCVLLGNFTPKTHPRT